MGKWVFTSLLFSIFISHSYGQKKNSVFLETLLRSTKDTIIKNVLDNPQEYRYQIIYTKIDRNKKGNPHFTHYYLHVDPNEYFYPASTVKLPLAALALEKINDLEKAGVNMFTPLSMDSIYPGLPAIASKTSTGQPNNIAQFIKEVLLVSDNDAYNRLYQFLGQQYINKQLQEKGYHQSQVVRQFAYLNEAQNRTTAPVHFYGQNNEIIYTQPAQYNTDSIQVRPYATLGTAYIDRAGTKVNAPMNFSRHNNLSLQDLQQMLQAIMFPPTLHKKQQFKLTTPQYEFLRQYLSQFPGETNRPPYDSSVYYDSFVKYFFRNGGHHLPPGVRVFNKVGWAYGTLTDVSYIVDFSQNVEYMLAATIYCNKDGILNDDKYDYEQIGLPFLYAVGQAIYQYELKRPRKHKALLDDFKINYEVRTPGSTIVSNVNN